MASLKVKIVWRKKTEKKRAQIFRYFYYKNPLIQTQF